MKNICTQFEVGEKVFFKSEKRGYTVKAFDERYVICTKPFNLQHTVIYTILDLQENIRSTNWFTWNRYDYAIQSHINKCLKDLGTGVCELSRKNAIKIDLC